MAMTPEQIAKMDKVSGLTPSKISEMDKISGIKDSSLGAKVQQGIYKIPIIGDIAQVVGATTGGIAAAIKTPQVEKQTMADQNKARELAIAARIELDPQKKKELLDRSRALSQGAGERASKYSETVDSVLPEWSKNKESPTKNNVKEMLTAYGVPSARAGLAAGELMMLLGGGVPKMGPQGAGFLKSLGRIGTKTAAGSTLGGVQGFVNGDDKTTEERLDSAKTGAIIGGVTSGVLSTTGEVVNAIRDGTATKSMIDALGKTGEKVQKIQNKTDILPKITSAKETAAKKIGDINYHEFLDSMKNDAAKITDPITRNNVIKRIDLEKSVTEPTMSFLDFVKAKSKASYNPGAKGASIQYSNLFKQLAGKEIHNISPEVSKYDSAYWLVKTAKSIPKKLLKAIGLPGSILLGLSKK